MSKAGILAELPKLTKEERYAGFSAGFSDEKLASLLILRNRFSSFLAFFSKSFLRFSN